MACFLLFQVAEQLNCPTNDTEEMVDCLRTKDAAELLRTDFNCTVSVLAFPVCFCFISFVFSPSFHYCAHVSCSVMHQNNLVQLLVLYIGITFKLTSKCRSVKQLCTVHHCFPLKTVTCEILVICIYSRVVPGQRRRRRANGPPSYNPLKKSKTYDKENIVLHTTLSQ